MKRHEVYTKFVDYEGCIYYFSMGDLQDVVNPIGHDGIDMDIYDDNVYICKDGDYQVLSL
jgi:hypothetical protein